MSETTPSLRRSFSWMFAGNVLYAASLWGIISALTKLGTPEAVGRYALAAAVATPLMLFANLQLRPIMATDNDGRFEFRDYLALRLICLPIAFVVIAVIAAWLYSGAQLAAILLFTSVRFFDGLSDIFHGFVQKHERIDLMARSLAFKGLGSLSLKPNWNAARLRALVWMSLPLGLAMMFIQLRNTIPRMILESEQGEAELGFFAAMAYLIIIGNTIVLALSQSSLVRLGCAYTDGDSHRFLDVLKKLVMVSVLLGVGGVLVAVLGGEMLLTLLYSEDYAQQGGVFVVLMMAGGLYYGVTMFGPAATAVGAFREQLVIQGMHSAVLLLLGLLLIPRYGMLGAAWSMVGGALWVLVAYGVTVRQYVMRMKVRSGV